MRGCKGPGTWLCRAALISAIGLMPLRAASRSPKPEPSALLRPAAIPKATPSAAAASPAAAQTPVPAAPRQRMSAAKAATLALVAAVVTAVVVLASEKQCHSSRCEFRVPPPGH